MCADQPLAIFEQPPRRSTTIPDRATGVFPRSSGRTIVGCAQAVARAPHRVEQGAVEALVDLLAQPADVNVDHVGLRVEVIVPDVLEQHRSGDDVTGIAHQVFEKPELARQYVDRLVAALHRSRQQIELEIGDPQLRRRLGRRPRRSSASRRASNSLKAKGLTR